MDVVHYISKGSEMSVGPGVQHYNIIGALNSLPAFGGPDSGRIQKHRGHVQSIPNVNVLHIDTTNS